MLRFMFVISFLFIGSCKLERKKSESKTPPTAEKIDANQLSSSLNPEDYSKGAISGLKLTIQRDKRADYVSFKICNSANACTTGRASGLLPELVYDAPKGEITITYQSCLLPDRALASPCGPEKSVTFNHQVDNNPPLFLALSGGNSLDLINKSIDSNFSSMKDQLNDMTHDDIQTFMKNLSTIDSSVWKQLLISKSFQNLSSAVKDALKANNNATDDSMTILVLGSSKMALDFFRKWETEFQGYYSQEVAEALVAAFTNYQKASFDQEDISSVSLMLANVSKVLKENDVKKKIISKFSTLELDILTFLNMK